MTSEVIAFICGGVAVTVVHELLWRFGGGRRRIESRYAQRIVRTLDNMHRAERGASRLRGDRTP